MRPYFSFVRVATLGSLFSVISVVAVGENPHRAALEAIEPRIRAIYEEGAFRGRPFRGDWTEDGLGYEVVERDEDSGRQRRVRYDVLSGKRSEVADRDRAGRQGRDELSPDGHQRLVSRGGNVYVRSQTSGESRALTQNPEQGAVSSGRAAWSPDGSRVVFVQTDRSEIRLRPMLVPGDPSYPEVRETRFARVGGKIAGLKVGVIDVETGETAWLPIPSPSEGFYLGQVEWAGNSYEVLVETLSRFRNERHLLMVDVRSMKVRTLFHEADPAWVVASYRKNAGLQWIDEGQAFVVISEKDGWRHAYRYSRAGEEEALLTKGEYDIIERAGIDENRGWYYFYASPKNGAQKYLYRVRIDGSGSEERVTPSDSPGTHDYRFSPDARWAFHTFSSFDSPPITELVELESHRVIRVLEDNGSLRAKVAAEDRPLTEFFQIDIGNDVVLDAWMLKPADFSPEKQYPLFVYVYGEPHAQTVLDAWGRVHAEYHRAIADLGYLVVSIDNRGTPAPKGAAWRRAVFGSLGPLSTEEQAEAVKVLARTRSYVDASRVGVWGWSGGGSNTLNAMFRRPDVFHVGIAVAPKPQAHLYNAWFQEIYMETRETNPEGYENASAIGFAEGLEGDLLIIHGTGETNTHLEIVEGLVDRLIELGKPFDYMTYPNRNHGIREGKGTSVHLRMHMIRYLLNHLPPGPR